MPRSRTEFPSVKADGLIEAVASASHGLLGGALRFPSVKADGLIEASWKSTVSDALMSVGVSVGESRRPH